MKVQVDEALCSANGQCAKVAAQLFQLDDEGYCKQVGETLDLSSEQEGAAEQAETACPESAIRVID